MTTSVNMHLAPHRCDEVECPTLRQRPAGGGSQSTCSTSGGSGGANRASRTWCTRRTYRGRASQPCASHAVQSGDASLLPRGIPPLFQDVPRERRRPDGRGPRGPRGGHSARKRPKSQKPDRTGKRTDRSSGLHSPRHVGMSHALPPARHPRDDSCRSTMGELQS
jgi:hypothetical protein